MGKNNAIRYILRVPGILFLLYGIGIQIFGKDAGMVFVWLVLGVLLLVVSVRKVYKVLFAKAWVKIVLSAGVLALVFFIVIIAVNGGRDKTGEASDYIIVLGCQIIGEQPSRSLQYRLDTAYDYLVEKKETKAVLSGGQAPNEVISEAEAMFRYLTMRGIDPDRLILEERSSDTYENLKYSFALIENLKDADICIVSSSFHLLRAKLLAHRLGVQAAGWGAPTYLPLVPNFYLREMMAILKDLVIR